MKNKDKIIRILSLLTTNKRDEVVRSYIEYIIISVPNVSSAQKIVDNTLKAFGLTLQVEEVEAELQWLRANDRIVFSNGKLELTDSVKEEFAKLDADSEKASKERCSRFQVDIQNLNKGKLPEDVIILMYGQFEEYLYDCFLEYGREAASIFKANDGESDRLTRTNSFLQKALSKIKKSEYKEIFSSYVFGFSENLTLKQAEYLELLANKAESFFALGLPQELHKEFLGVAPLGWTVFLDTNVLYSILKLHSHGENEAVRAIVKMNKEFNNIFHINFKYLPLTYKELRLLKSDLERDVISINLNQKQIVAALGSGRLDGYTKSYYENMLENGPDTLHPSKVVDTAVNALKAKGIELYNRNLFKEGEEPEEFKDKISAYNTFQQIRNEARVERGIEYKAPKSVDRIEHDVTLREMILLLRSSSDFSVSTSVADCKVYGLTIDKALIDFDNFERRKPSNLISGFIPSFFFPSYLLKRMYRYLPVQSDDYRKSFISSVSSPFLPSSGKDSSLVQKTMAHFRAMGVDDSDFIISRLTDEMFVQTVNSFENSEDAESFIESDINKAIDAKSREIAKNARQISAIESKLQASVNTASAKSAENENLKADKETLEQHVQSLTAAVGKLNSQFKKGLKAQRTVPLQEVIPFPDEKDKAIQELKEQVAALAALHQSKADDLQKVRAEKISNYKDAVAKRWQRQPRIWFWGLIAFGTLATAVAFYIFGSDIENKNFKTIGTGIVGGLSYILSAYLLKEIQNRNSDFKNINEYKNQIKIPDNL